ncbi:MAG: ATP-binding cassette domain-containing protein [Planctomycetes bacterium]|nr:ATP-binding cassette domain-containing protein [Planctomycetota bacterium]
MTIVSRSPAQKKTFRPARWIGRWMLSDFFILGLAAVYFLVLCGIDPRMAGGRNIANLASSAWPLLALVLGQMFVLITGGIDLSQTSIMALTSVLGGILMTSSVQPEIFAETPLWGVLLTEEGGILAGLPGGAPIGLLAMVAAGAAVGLLNGLAVAKLRMPPFLVTLLSMMFFSGLALYLTQSENIRRLPDAWIALGKGQVGSVPLALLLVAGLALAAHVLLQHTVLGRWLYAVGKNPRAARISGIPVDRVVIAAYAFSGLMAAIASILYSARLEGGRPTLGEDKLLDIIGAAVIGGISLFGGKGRVSSAVCGVAFFVLLANSLDMMSHWYKLPYFTVNVVKGSVILLAALLDVGRTWLRMRGGGSPRREKRLPADAETRPSTGPDGLRRAARVMAGESSLRPPRRDDPPAAAPSMARDPSSPAVLEFRGTGKSYFGVPVLRGIDLSLARGEILGLVGENGAGKTTLMNILGGVARPDEGTMRLDGEIYSPRGPHDARRAGVAFIHQELNLFGNLSIADNLFIDGFPRRAGLLIDRRAARRRAAALLGELGLDLDPDMRLDRLAPGEQQLVEVARALGQGAGLIIFDEPTTSLTSRETAKLFDVIRKLRDERKAVIYISHVLDDVLRLADRVAVLRDGALVDVAPREQLTAGRLISCMVGREISDLHPRRSTRPSPDVVLEVSDLGREGAVEDIGFALRRGEVLGLFGLMGSGRTELARLIFGLDARDSGSVRVRGEPLGRLDPRRAVRKGLALVTENRRDEGLLPDASASDNLALAALERFARRGPGGFVNRSALARAVEGTARALQIRSRDLRRQPVQTLSGGNQQKVVIGKWLLASPSVFLLDEPTRGIDVGARYEVYSIINRLAEKGAGVLFISSEIEELIGMCDRILVLHEGRMRAELPRDAFDPERILAAAFGWKEER